MRSCLALAGALGAAFPSTASAQNQPWLHAPVELTNAAGDFHLLGDVDLDGDLDAIAFQNGANAYKASFTVWTNDGTGAFAAGAATPLPAQAGIHLLYADVDGDGRGDLVLSAGLAPNPTRLLLFAGLANGTFAPFVQLPLPGHVMRLHAGNGNGDGVTDLLVQHAGAFPGETRWIFGGAGFALTLGPATVLPMSSDHCAVDANGDGLDDVALTVDGAPDAVQFHVTTATGFAPGATVPLPNSSLFHIAALDHDGDGDRDLLVTNHGGGSNIVATICRNLGGGAWSPNVQTIANVVAGAMHVGDWNGDGRDDVAMSASSPSTSTSLVLLQSSGPNLVRRYSIVMSAIPAGLGAGFGDLNQDGHADFLGGDSVWFGDGTFTEPFGSLDTGVLLDWDGDGDQDLFAAGALQLHDGNGAMTPAPLGYPPLPANHFYSGTGLVTDLDGDGRHEVLVGVSEALFLQSVFRETHLLREGPDRQFVFAGLAAPAPLRLDAGVVDDTDGDGDLDIVDASGLWLNTGAGFFVPQGAITSGYRPVAKGDVDGDGDQDLLATTSGGGTSLAILYRTAPNTWSTVVLFPSNGGSIENAAPKRFVDVDDDGDLDVVARERVTTNTWNVLVFTNQGGVFTQALALPYQATPLVGDVDGDGLTDLAVSEGRFLRVLRRIGPGLVYEPPVTFLTPPRDDLVDLDQDGDLDATGSQGLVQNRRFRGPAAGFRRQYGNGSLGAGGWRPLLSVRGPIREGRTPVLSLRAAPGGTAALLILGSGATNVPSVILPGVQSYVAPIDLLLGFTVGGTWGQPGTGTLDLPVPVPTGLAGANLFLEYVVLDPAVAGAFTHSNGCQFSVGL